MFTFHYLKRKKEKKKKEFTWNKESTTNYNYYIGM